jgi:histidyl-tRNA synthetase
MEFQKPKGTEDFFPEDMEQRNRIFGSLRSTAARFGYNEVSSPAFETLSLLTKKGGEEIRGQIFTLEKRSTEEFGLRFDLTVPLTRMFIEKQKSQVKPVKWFSLDRMWRYEQPQKGRLREFYQLSVELFGTDSIYADAEIISLAITCLTDLGLTEKDFYLKLNSRKLLQALLLEILPEDKLEAAIRLIDKKSKITEDEFVKELKKEGIDKTDEILALLNKSLSDISSENGEVAKALSDINRLLDLLGDKNKFVRFDISTARGLAYYTGIVFEAFDCEEKFRALLGGGRYDNLVELFGGQKTPATGFGIGYATLSLLLKEKNLLPDVEKAIDYYIAPLSEKEYKESLRVAAKLRKKYTVLIDLAGRNLGNQFKYANSMKARKVIVIGENEVVSGEVTVKDTASGKEEKITLKELLK